MNKASAFAQQPPQQIADQDPLVPVEVSLRSGSWLNRATSYPVFSRTWFRYRTMSVLFSVALMEIIFLLLMLVVRDSWRAVLVPSLALGVGLLSLMLSGPGLAVLVRMQAWPQSKEAASLVAALILGLLLTAGLFSGTKYLSKLVLFGDAKTQIEMGVNTSFDSVQKPANPGAVAAQTAAAGSARGAPADNEDNLVVIGLEVLVMLALVVRFSGWVDLVVFFRQRRRLEEALRGQEMARLQAARNEAELRLSVLAAQIEPHFLFNTLAGVRSAIVCEPQRAVAIVDHLVDYLRATIPQLRSEGGSAQGRLGAQMDAARAYLALMQARIPRLSYAVQADAGLDEALVPPLTLVSLVENAVKHGIEPKVGPGRIEVTARRVQADGRDALELSVADDGVGFGGTTSGSGIGLSNIRERLEALYGRQAGLSLKALPNGGVAATIALPLSN